MNFINDKLQIKYFKRFLIRNRTRIEFRTKKSISINSWIFGNYPYFRKTN